MQSQITVQNRSVPTFIYGTAWKEEDTERCVLDALQCGFRGIDTANQRKHYYEAGVGSALLRAYDAGIVAREDIFLQTKFTHLAGQDHRLPYDPAADMQTQVMQSFTSSLEHLHTDHLDSYVLHGPSTRPGLADQDWQVWQAMEELHRSGKVSFLGVSNVTLEQLQLIYEQSAVKPTFAQIRCYARNGWDQELRAFCREHDIWYQGFSLLTANRNLLRDPRFLEIVKHNQRTPAQVVFRFSLQVGMLPLTGTTSVDHMREDLAIYDFELSQGEIESIESLARS